MIFQYLLPAPEKKFSPEECPNCPLGPRARKVGARGTPDAPLVIILEAPGSEELKFGAPVCGPSGDLLNKSVPEHFDFDDAYVINAMQCRPPKFNDQIKDKEFKARACAACRVRVLNQIFRYPRKCVLAMGAWSNSALTGNYTFKITQQRGVVYAITHPESGEEVIVVPTVHPAYLLRGSGNPKVFRDDIAIAYNLAYGTESSKALVTVRAIEWSDPDNRVLESLDDFGEYVHYLGELATAYPEGRIAVGADIETTGFNAWREIIRSIGFYVNDDRDTAAIVPKEALLDKAYCYYLRAFFRDERFKFVWQNGKFDQLFLILEGLVDKDQELVHEDTLLLSYALSEATKDHDLDEQAKNFLGAPDHKWIVKKWGKNADDFYRNAPDPVLFDYQAKDLKKTLLLYEHHRSQVAADGALEKLYTRTLLPASHVLTQIEEYGIAVDMDYVRINQFGATDEDRERGLVPVLFDRKTKQPEPEIGLENELLAIERQLEDLVGYKVNPNSPDEVAALLYERYDLRIKNKRPTDTRKETLDKLPEHPSVKLIRKYRSLRKMLGTYVAAIHKHAVDGIIHTTFKLHASTTGRLSSSEPNIQNIPRDPRWRRMYCARPGYVLLESDYNSAELRMLAALSGDPFLMQVFLDDTRNLHDEVSIKMYGPEFSEDQRIRAKAINFGIPYGREAFSIAEEFDITPGEAQKMIDDWFAIAPGAHAFLKRSRSAPSRGQTLVTVFGRKRRPGVVSAERLHGLQNEFANFHMQSPISDFTLHSAMEMLPVVKTYGAHIVNLVHDSTVTEVPNDPVIIERVARIIKEVMEEVPRKWISTPITFKADMKIGTHWGLGKKYVIGQEIPALSLRAA